MQSQKIHVAGSSIVGRSHVANNRPCEDAWASALSPMFDCRAVVVCDGAGSKPKGKIGAKITSRLVAQWLIENFEQLQNCQSDKEVLKQKLIHKIHRVINKYRVANHCTTDSIMDYSCTMLGVVIDDKNQWHACHIGDGGIVGKDNDNNTFIVSQPSKGEFANTTFFVTGKDAVKNLQFYSNTRPAHSFALFSDGLENSLIQSKQGDVAPVMGRILDWLLDNSESDVTLALENSLKDVFSKRTIDDCTLVLMTTNPVITDQIINECTHNSQDSVHDVKSRKTKRRLVIPQHWHRVTNAQRHPA